MNMDLPDCLLALPAVPASLQRLSAAIAVARGLAASGRTIDLGGLESLTGLLCAQVLDLEPSDGAALRPSIAVLHTDVSALIETLKSNAP